MPAWTHEERRGERERRAPACAAFALLAAAVWFGGSGCATNPATGGKELILVSESQEIEMGRQANQSVQAQFGSYEDAELEAYVASIGKRLAAVSERPDLPWEFHVLDSPVINAFALPGGFIYISRGMLAVLNSEAQLAGVLGHEIGHVTARHSAQQMSRSQLAQITLGVGSIFIDDFDTIGQAAGLGLSLLFLKYSRDDEHEADLLGVRYATRASYDPREMPDTYRALAQLQEESGQSLPSFLSTHPDPGSRAERTAQLAAEAVDGSSASLVVNRVACIRHTDGLVYGEDPRQGFVEGSVFYHPELQFQWAFPRGWQVQNLPQAVTVGEPQGTAAFQLTLVSSQGTASPSAYAEYLVGQGVISDARGRSGTIGGWPAWMGELTVINTQGDRVTMHAAWVARETSRYYQFLGAPGTASVGAIFGESVATFSVLTDPELLARQPDRVHVATVQQPTTSLAAVAGAFANLTIPLEEVAFINGLSVESTLREGQLVKVVLGSGHGNEASSGALDAAPGNARSAQERALRAIVR